MKRLLALLRARPGQALALLLVSAATLSLLVRLVQLFGAAYTDDDQTLYWFGATELARLSFAEPCFYGQPYNTLFEALVAAPLVAVGVSPHVAVPIGASLVGLTPWLCLAVVALRRQVFWLALLALGAPLLLPDRYGMVLTMARGFHTGVALAALGWTIAAWREAPSASRAALGAWLLVLGTLATPNAALLSVPAGLHLALTHVRRWRVLAGLVLGGLAAAGLWWLATSFYRWYPEYDLFPLTRTTWTARRILDALGNTDHHLAELVPLFGGRSELLLVPPLVALGFAWRARAYRVMAVIVVAVLLTVASFGLEKVHEGTSSVYHPLLRMFLALPPLLLWLALLPIAPPLEPRPALGRGALFVLVALLAFGASRHVRLRGGVERAANEGSGAVTHGKVAPLRAMCTRLWRVADAEGAPVIVFLNDRIAAYGCGALLAGRVETLVPDFERRTWRLFEEAERRPPRLLFADAKPGVCAQARSAGMECKRIDREVVSVDPRGHTTLWALRKVKGRLRRFHGRPHDAAGDGIAEDWQPSD